MFSRAQLSILTDEVSQDLERVITFAREFQLGGIELRSLGGKAFRDLTLGEIREVRTRCDDAGLRVSGCATPVFKCDLDSSSEIEEHLQLFRRSVEGARILGCQVVRVFAFLRRTHPARELDLQRAAAHFLPLLDLAREAEVLVGVENEASCIVGDGRETAIFLRALPEDAPLGVVWDPCNVLYLAGDTVPYPEQYEQIAARVAHVHVKDARRADGRPASECVELGEGEIDFPGQFRALSERGYGGWITLETHWRPVRLDAATQHLPAGHAFSENAEPASRLCLQRLLRMLEL